MKPKKKLSSVGISLVMPVYNEAESIEEVIQSYAKVLQKFPDSEFVLCEDGSTDGTKEILKRLQKKYRLTLFQTPTRQGAVKGFLNALSHASKEIVWFSDSDNTHDPADVIKLLNEIGAYDMVIGRKHPRHDPFFRLFTSWGMNMFINLLYGIRFHDMNSGFRLIRKSLLKRFLPKLGTFPGCTLTELTLLAIRDGYKVIEVPVTHYFRKGGSRAIRPSKILSLALGIIGHIVRIRFL